MAHIFCSDKIIDTPLEKLRSQGHTLEIWDKKINGELNSDILKDKLKNADAFISMLSDKIDSETLKYAVKLKVIAQYAVGYNNIDLLACQNKNIIVTNTPDVLTHATAELAFALLLNCARNIQAATMNVKNLEWQSWEPQAFLGKSLHRQKLGIIGAGKIGKCFAKMCQGAFDMEVSFITTKNTRLELESLLRESDIISLHTPLTKQTRNLIGAPELSLMKEDCILINTARGEIIDEAQLIKALLQGKFHGVGLDVTATEPLPKTSQLREFERVIITPHIGSATLEARTKMATLCVQNVEHVLLGKPPISRVSI